MSKIRFFKIQNNWLGFRDLQYTKIKKQSNPSF